MNKNIRNEEKTKSKGRNKRIKHKSTKKLNFTNLQRRKKKHVYDVDIKIPMIPSM